MVVTMTHFGYVKRLPKRHLPRAAPRRQGRQSAWPPARRTSRSRPTSSSTRTTDIMFFTNRGRVYNLKCYQIPEAGRTARGTAIVNLLQTRRATKR